MTDDLATLRALALRSRLEQAESSARAEAFDLLADFRVDLELPDRISRLFRRVREADDARKAYADALRAAGAGGSP